MSALAWVTLLSALAYLAASVLGYMKKKTIAELAWIVSSIGFLVIAAALVAIPDPFTALGVPGAVFIGTLYPSFLALGLLHRKGEFAGIKDIWKYYLYLIIIILIIMAGGQAAGARGISVGAEVFLHIISGLIVFFLPLIEVIGKRWDVKYLLFTLGSIVIGIGGIALAIVSTGAEMMGITVDLVLLLLHPLLFLSAFIIAFAVYLVTQSE